MIEIEVQRKQQIRIPRPIVAFPLLLGIYPIINLYATNSERLRISDIFASLAIVVVAISILLIAGRLLFGNGVKAALWVSVLVILFFSYGHVHNLLLDRMVLGRHRYLLPLYGLILVVATFAVLKAGNAAQHAVAYLNIVAALLVAIPLLRLGYHAIKLANFHIETLQPDIVTAQPAGDEELPSIYYIILDEYASADVLREYYGYDNSAFIDFLTDRGFYVAADSHSNYAWTHVSLASTLNMQYLDNVATIAGVDSTDKSTTYRMVRTNAVRAELQARGYTYIHFASGWGPTDYSKYADTVYEYGFWNEFNSMLLETTPLDPLYTIPAYSETTVRKAAYNLEHIGGTANGTEPTFVFAHVVMPHGPYVFDRNGNTRPRAEFEGLGVSSPEAKQAYLEQLMFLNLQVEEVVDEILAQSEVPPIIILQGDHGTISSASDVYTLYVPTKSVINERFGILNAYYLPGDGASQLYPSITPVNTFRLIFDHYLGTDLGLLEDRVYFSPNKYPYDFLDVTDDLYNSTAD